MNSPETVTMRQFFLAEKELWKERLSVLESGEKMSLLKARVLKEAKMKWPVALDCVAEKIADLLNIAIPDIMVMAWKKYRILLAYTDSKKYPPGEVSLVPLAEHTISSEHHPFLEILINNQPFGKIEFHISVSLALESAILKIQDGKIMAVTAGTCKGKGTIECENLLIMEKQTQPISLPGTISLGEGVPIVALPGAEMEKSGSSS